ncbi:MAG: tyrosine-type recombinase/integrase [Caulobacter sp.]|nr:tyrosine-type recombinase/integrase [Caulobacter sp.]
MTTAIVLNLPGTHRVLKRLAGGRIAIYRYRYRGGPLLMRFEGETLGAALRAERAGATSLAASYAEAARLPEKATTTLADIVANYKQAPDGLPKLAPSTQAHWRRSLDRIVVDLGTLPAKALASDAVKRVFLDWRNGFAKTPRQADYNMQVIKRVLSWAVENAVIKSNHAAGIRGLYRSDRADMIVEPDELRAILERTTPYAALAIRLAAATGMRREDLTKLQWRHVKEGYIQFETGKSRGRKTVLVPLFEDARLVLDILRGEREAKLSQGKVPSAFVLLSERGTPWVPNSLTQAFGRAAKELGIERDFNDLRGTAITRFYVNGLSDEMVADIVGWEIGKVRNIRKHYVDPSRVALGIIKQVEGAAKTG